MISNTGEYVLKATLCMASRHPTSSSVALLAAQTSVPSDYLSKILQSLGRDGLVTSRRGRGGGFILARDPADISILDVLKGAGVSLRRTNHRHPGLADYVVLCSIHELVDEQMKIVEDRLRSVTLACFVGRDAAFSTCIADPC